MKNHHLAVSLALIAGPPTGMSDHQRFLDLLSLPLARDRISRELVVNLNVPKKGTSRALVIPRADWRGINGDRVVFFIFSSCLLNYSFTRLPPSADKDFDP